MLNHWFTNKTPQTEETQATAEFSAVDIASLDAEGLCRLVTAPNGQAWDAQREEALARLADDEVSLKRVVKWAGEHDKNLYRLAQGHLLAIRTRQQAGIEAQRLLEQFEQLLASDIPALNRVVELDHAWEALRPKLDDAPSLEKHQQLRASIETRLQARTLLQQQANILRTQLEGLRADIDSAGQIKLDGLAEQLATTAEALPVLVASKEISALSSTQVVALDEALQSALTALANRRAHFDAVAAIPSVASVASSSSQPTPKTKPPKKSMQVKQERAQEANLRDWQKFGTEVVRQGLIEEALALLQNQCEPEALGRSVRELRERWKAVDTQMGHGAPAPLWKRFDDACEKAYAPVVAWLAENAQLRVQLAEQAEAALSEWLAAPTPDWRKLHGVVDNLRQRWRALGGTPRTEAAKEATRRFEAAWAQLFEPLQAQRQKEENERRDLIARAHALGTQTHVSFGKLRLLQDEWQNRAKSFPLTKAKEQSFWLEFRDACNVVMTQIKQKQTAEREREHAERHERQQRQDRAKRALHSALEKIKLAPQLNDNPELVAEWKSLQEKYGDAGALQKALQQRVDQPEPYSANFRDDLITLEIELGVPSPGDETRRRELQIGLLARKLKGEKISGGTLSALQTLLRQRYTLADAQRLVVLVPLVMR